MVVHRVFFAGPPSADVTTVFLGGSPPFVGATDAHDARARRALQLAQLFAELSAFFAQRNLPLRRWFWLEFYDRIASFDCFQGVAAAFVRKASAVWIDQAFAFPALEHFEHLAAADFCAPAKSLSSRAALAHCGPLEARSNAFPACSVRPVSKARFRTPGGSRRKNEMSSPNQSCSVMSSWNGASRSP